MKNYYEIEGNVAKIRIDRKNSDSLWTFIDKEDLSLLEKISKVHARWNEHTKTFYVQYHCCVEGKWTTKQLHQLLMGFPGCLVDHINHDTLNNTRSNLRTASYSENNSNIKFRKDNTSGYKGVYWNKSCGKYQAGIFKNRKFHYLGLYSDPEEASKAYKKAALELFKEFASFGSGDNGCFDVL